MNNAQSRLAHPDDLPEVIQELTYLQEVVSAAVIAHYKEEKMDPMVGILFAIDMIAQCVNSMVDYGQYDSLEDALDQLIPIIQEATLNRKQDLLDKKRPN